jgi:hypothetical protein
VPGQFPNECWASCKASAGAISNSVHTTRSTISPSGVDPSAACQMADGVSFRLNSVESRADMIIISPPNMRAATSLLRAIYTALIRLTPRLFTYAGQTSWPVLRRPGEA